MPFPHVVLLVLLCCCWFTGGCAPLIVAGAAGAGYVATHEEPRGKVEQFFDDLGRSIRQTTRRITADDRPSARRSSNARPAEDQGGFSLAMIRSSLAPAKVKPGDSVTLTLQYRVSGAPDQGVGIREKSTLFKDGKELTVLREGTADRENGTWESTLTFAVPASARSGKYAVILQVSGQGKSRSVRRLFTVQ